ncbi:MAG: putative transcription regulator containing domain [Planctomycetaceae bacterium]|nr:putative transcription regulator containing domain [Planctomycetaceae bacterium]
MIAVIGKISVTAIEDSSGGSKMSMKQANVAHQASKVRLALGGLLQFAKQSGSRASASYLKLVVAFPIRPLRNDDELNQAIGVLDRLLSRKKPLDDQEQGYFDSLSHEIEYYEDANVPMPEVSGIAMLRHLIDTRNATLSEVAAGAEIAVSTMSSVLGGKRKLNRTHIEKLARYFEVKPGLFLD